MSHCSTCNVVLNSGDVLRSHYNSELHIENVRRRVEGLCPLMDKEQHSRKPTNVEGNNACENGQAPLFSCTLCKKTFHSIQTLQAHIRSIAHLMLKEKRILAKDSEAVSVLTTISLGSAAMGLHRRHNAKNVALGKSMKEKGKTKIQPKVDVTDREKDTTETRCLFCGHLSDSLGANVEHLQEVHDFFIPMAEHCTDVQGLLAYMSRKVNGLLCLVCNEKTRSFSSLSALRDHMRESDHEKIILGPEYQEFYTCLLEDPDAAVSPALKGTHCGEIVLPNSKEGKKRILLMREVGVPYPRPREAPQEAETRRAILAASHQENEVIKREQHESLAEQQKQDARVLRRSEGDFHQHQLKVNLRSNKLHPKGYDGEGKLN